MTLPSRIKWFPELRLTELRLLWRNMILVLNSAVNWRVTVVAKRMAPMAKPARV